jgi:FkbM family methyltransferase
MTHLELLARNIFLNKLSHLITIVPLALSEKLMFSDFKMTTTGWGGAMSTFDESFGHDGLKLDSEFDFSTIGLSMEDAVGLLKLPQPDYIKMDVDGIEHLILKSGGAILRNTKGILIEINEKFIKQAEDASMYLKDAGFILKEKRHADFFDNMETAAKYTYNQIWVKKY